MEMVRQVNKYSRNSLIMINIRDTLYLSSFAIYFSYLFLRTTMFYIVIPNQIHLLVAICSTGLIIIKVLGYDAYTIRQLVIIILFIAIVALVWVNSGYTNLIMLALLILGAKNISFKKIVRVHLTLGLLLLIITILSSLVGIIPNLVYQQDDRIRNSFGAIYPTDFAAHVFYLVLSYCYIKGKNLRLFDYTLFLILAILLLYFCDARLDSISIILTVLAMLLLSFKKNRPIRRIINFLLSYSVPICATFFIILTIIYSPNNENLIKLNSLLSNRLSLGKYGIEEYGFSLFGKYIEMSGWGGLNGFNKKISTYFFIDSSFLKITLTYGIIFTLFICVMYVSFCKDRIKNNDILLPTLIALASLNSMIAHHFIDLAYNPFLFIFLSKIGNNFREVKL